MVPLTPKPAKVRVWGIRCDITKVKEKHEIKRLSADERYLFMKQYMESASFNYDDDSVKNYAKEDHSQAEIMTYMTRCIAKTLIEKKEVVFFN